MPKFQTISELLNYTENIKGKKFKEFDKNNELNVTSLKDKGILGKRIETEFYQYPNNTNAKADFDNLGIELKVTGFKKNKTRKKRKSLCRKRKTNPRQNQLYGNHKRGI